MLLIETYKDICERDNLTIWFNHHHFSGYIQLDDGRWDISYKSFNFECWLTSGELVPLTKEATIADLIN